MFKEKYFLRRVNIQLLFHIVRNILHSCQEHFYLNVKSIKSQKIHFIMNKLEY